MGTGGHVVVTAIDTVGRVSGREFNPRGVPRPRWGRIAASKRACRIRRIRAPDPGGKRLLTRFEALETVGVNTRPAVPPDRPTTT